MPQHGIIGDVDGSLVEPSPSYSEEDLSEVRNAAKFSKSAEYKKLKQHFNDRMEFYRQFLPDGTPLTQTSPENRESMWVAANTIIGEFRAVMAVYEQANEAVKDIERVRRKGA